MISDLTKIYYVLEYNWSKYMSKDQNGKLFKLKSLFNMTVIELKTYFFYENIITSENFN